MDTIKEQFFDFDKEAATNATIAAIIALAKIPLENYKIRTYPTIVQVLKTTYGFELWKSQNGTICDDAVSFSETNFCVEEIVDCGSKSDESTDEEGDIFTVNLEPESLYNSKFTNLFWFTFCHHDKVILDFMDNEHKSRMDRYISKHTVKRTMTWQEAYDVLCEIARTEARSVPALKEKDFA